VYTVWNERGKDTEVTLEKKNASDYSGVAESII